MAAEDGEGRRRVDRVLARDGASQVGSSIDNGDAITMAGELVGGRETGEASAENDDGLSVSGRHENRARIQTPAARANR